MDTIHAKMSCYLTAAAILTAASVKQQKQQTTNSCIPESCQYEIYRKPSAEKEKSKKKSFSMTA